MNKPTNVRRIRNDSKCVITGQQKQRSGSFVGQLLSSSETKAVNSQVDDFVCKFALQSCFLKFSKCGITTTFMSVQVVSLGLCVQRRRGQLTVVQLEFETRFCDSNRVHTVLKCPHEFHKSVHFIKSPGNVQDE